jgi:hypothetical protein
LARDPELVEAVAVAVAGYFDVRDWDREVAVVAIRRWESFERRTGGKGDRVADLARGLKDRFGEDEPGWHRWTAEAVAEVLSAEAG